LAAIDANVLGENMHTDHADYFHYTGKSRLEKSLNSLLGLIAGIAVDSSINAREIEFLRTWLQEHEDVVGSHPFNELIPVVNAALADGILTEDEKEDILWLCEKLRSTEYFDLVTADMQSLHAMLGGVAADGVISELELRGLSAWLSEHQHLARCWPFDEVCSLVSVVLTDGRIDQEEHRMLMGFFGEFTALLDDRTVSNPFVDDGITVAGLCAVCPEISFQESVFCFTGASQRHTRAEFADMISRQGGEFVNSVSKKVDYLIIGADGNPCWAFACYGRKVERAVELRREGSRLLIIHENDLLDALADLE
jgi:hypothetical protein